MRTNLSLASLVAAVVLAPALASAEPADTLVGRYEVTFQQVTSNCQASGLSLAKGTLVVSKRSPGIAVELDRIPSMSGKVAKAGRLKAASGLGRTSTAQEGKFSIAGTVDDAGKLDAVFVAEFYAAGKPLCTQSWSVAGTRAPEAKPQASEAPSTRFVLPPMD